MNGGHSIAVYSSEENDEKAKKYVEDNRASYIAPANFGKNQRISKIMTEILKKIAANENLKELSN